MSADLEKLESFPLADLEELELLGLAPPGIEAPGVEAPPGRVGLAAVEPAGTSAAERPSQGPASLAGVDPQDLRAALASLAGKHQVPGAQLAIHHDGRTVAVEFGELEHQTSVAVTRDAAFPIGSISKCFTATTAMVLVADGDVELDEPLQGHVPELAGLGAPVTLRQLLSHTAGLAAGPDAEKAGKASLRRYVAEHCNRESLLLAPGAGFSYSNLGYVLAGHVIETITGMSWWEAVESVLLRPLGIEPSFVVAPGSRPSRSPVAVGHSVNTLIDRIRPVPQSLAPALAPAGALALSAADLVAFGQVHVGMGVPGLLPGSYAEQMRQAVPGADPAGLADAWGLGLAVFHGGGAHWVGHDGNGDGTSCYLRIDGAAGWVVAFTSNASNGLGLWEDLIAELGGASFPVIRSRACMPAGRPVGPLLSAVGAYSNGDAEFVVTAADAGLRLSAGEYDLGLLTCHDGLAFSLPDPDTGQQVLGGRFVRDAGAGEIIGIQVGGRFARRHAEQSWDAMSA